MIGLFSDATGNPRVSLAYNGLTLNDPADTIESTSVLPQTYAVEVVASQTALDYISENKQQTSGIEVYNMRKAARVITMRGYILAPSYGKLYDMIEALAAAFDPAQIQYDNPINPFLPLTFSTPTADSSNFPSLVIPCQYYALPLKMPEPLIVPSKQGVSASFDITLLLKDPRRYLQAQTQQSSNGTVANSLAHFNSWPTLTVVMSGVGDTNFTIRNTATQNDIALVLDLSANGVGTWVVDFARRLITRDGATDMSPFVSGDYFEMEPGNNVILFSNTTNTSSRILSFYPAYSM